MTPALRPAADRWLRNHDGGRFAADPLGVAGVAGGAGGAGLADESTATELRLQWPAAGRLSPHRAVVPVLHYFIGEIDARLLAASRAPDPLAGPVNCCTRTTPTSLFHHAH